MSAALTLALGCVVGMLGTGIGGLGATLAIRPKEKHISLAMSFSAGIMLAVTFLDMLPAALKNNMLHGLMSIAGGISFMYAARWLLKGAYSENMSGNYANISFMMIIGIAVHNLPEGMAVGCGISSPDISSVGIALAILLHDAPEGMAVALPLRLAGSGVKRTLIITLLSGLPTGIGALLGYVIGNASYGFMDFCAGFAGGAMMLLVFADMLPETARISGKSASFAALLAGILAGAGIVMIG